RFFYGNHRVIFSPREVQAADQVTVHQIREFTQTAERWIDQYLTGRQRESVAEIRHLAETCHLAEICRLYVKGAEIDWSRIYQDQPLQRLHLPGYPFEKIRCWLEAPPAILQYWRELASGQKSNLAEVEPSFIEAVAAFLAQYSVKQREGSAEPEFSSVAVEEYGLLLLLLTFQRMGVFNKADEKYTVADFRQKIGLIDKYQRFCDAVLEMLEIKGKFIKRDGERLRVTTQVAQAAITQQLSALSSMRDALITEYPQAQDAVQLLELCINNYPDILTGKTPAASILFSDKANEWVANIYRGGNRGAYFNEMAAGGIRKLLETYSQFAKPGSTIRILELGAGLGATTGRVVKEIADSKVAVLYYYTDISLSFVNYGYKTFGADYPFTVFEKLDLEKDLEDQGFQLNSFDIILAANVIHATRDIKQSLRQIKGLLKSRGILFLIEVTQMQEFSTLTFGTLDGWWLSEDRELRIRHSPMLSREMWAEVLRDGFTGVKEFAGESGNQVLILAENDGGVEFKPRKDRYSSLGKRTGRVKEIGPVTLSGRKNGDYTDAEKTIAQIWGEVLGFAAIDIYDNFFELGGDSIIASKVINLANERLRMGAKVADLLQNLSVKAFAQFITTAHLNARDKLAGYLAIKRLPEAEFYPVSSAQKRQFILNQLARNDTNYNVPVATLISGPIDRRRIESAFRQLIERHEALRTSFALINEEPAQRIHHQVDFQVEYWEMADDGGEGNGHGGAGSDPRVQSIIRDFIRPFDLSQAPLIRVGLIRISDTRHLLLFDIHHIIADGASLGIMVRELARIYAGLTLPELQVQYKDFAVWQNERLQSAAMEKQAEFWLATFQGEIPVLHLPTDFPRPPIQSFEGATIGAPVPPEVVAGLNQLVVNTQSSLYMILLAAFQILLYKYTGQPDIIIGSPIAGREQAELENIVGMFANTLAMRNSLDPEHTVVEFLETVKANSLKAYANQEYQFEELVDKLNLERDLSRNPLFDVMFALQNMDNPVIVIDDLQFARYPLENKTSKFDLTLEAVQFQQNLTINFEYSTCLFKKETIERLARHFWIIVDQILSDPKLKIAAIDLLSSTEKEQLLFQFNQTRLSYPVEKTVSALFEEQAARTPQKKALQYSDSSLTYRELDEKANQIAGILLAKGVKPDCPVGILVNRSLEMMIGIMAILKAGAAYLPIDPEYPDDRIRYMLADSETAFLLTQRHLRNRGGFEGEIVELDDEQLYQRAVTVLETTATARNLAYIIYTSGSTGKPKGVMIEHQAVHNFILGITNRIDFAPQKT
ncbi:MAG TPA: condensation domain-containing protein, partial [Bacillota bacterium]|nr:condensation domain-containing protein [Bacillota bacterium]